MQMVDLRRLVERYVDDAIDYSAFRREFVLQFLAVRANPEVDSAVAEIESLCADRAEGLLGSEAEMKLDLARIVRPREVAGIGFVTLAPTIDVLAQGWTTIAQVSSSGYADCPFGGAFSSSTNTRPAELTLTAGL
jgi:hypothetical protein